MERKRESGRRREPSLRNNEPPRKFVRANSSSRCVARSRSKFLFERDGKSFFFVPTRDRFVPFTDAIRRRYAIQYNNRWYDRARIRPRIFLFRSSLELE